MEDKQIPKTLALNRVLHISENLRLKYLPGQLQSRPVRCTALPSSACQVWFDWPRPRSVRALPVADPMRSELGRVWLCRCLLVSWWSQGPSWTTLWRATIWNETLGNKTHLGKPQNDTKTTDIKSLYLGWASHCTTKLAPWVACLVGGRRPRLFVMDMETVRCCLWTIKIRVIVK